MSRVRKTGRSSLIRVMWTSRDQGHKWTKVKQVTHAKHFNHIYAKKPSKSALYFTDKGGRGVWLLPVKMKSDFELPEKVK